MRPRYLLLAAGILCAAPGCRGPNTYGSSPAVEEGVAQWSATVSRLGLVPVFPPREDLQAGDIYAFPYNPESPGKEADAAGEGFGLQASRWMQVKNLNRLLKDEYQARPSWRETTGSTPGGSDVAEEDGPPRRLRLVAFPDFVGATFRSNSGLLGQSGLIPSEVMDLSDDSSARWVSMMSLKLPSAESYALSQVELLKELIDPSGPKKMLRSPYLESIRWRGDQDRLWLRVVAEVYTIRSMDISVEYASKPRKAAYDGYAAPAPNPGTKVRERLRNLNEAIQANGAQNSPGSTLKFLNASENRVALRRTWDRGVCIGFRGFTLEIDAKTGEVLHLRPLEPQPPPEPPKTPAQTEAPSS